MNGVLATQDPQDGPATAPHDVGNLLVHVLSALAGPVEEKLHELQVQEEVEVSHSFVYLTFSRKFLTVDMGTPRALEMPSTESSRTL